MKRLLLACAILGLAWPIWAREPCKVHIHRHERHTSTADKKAAYRLAGIPWEKRACCTVDHRIALELGGTDSLNNLQIQPKEEAKAKDRVEGYLASQVCKGNLTLAQAQKQVIHWRSVRLPEPSSRIRKATHP